MNCFTKTRRRTGVRPAIVLATALLVGSTGCTHVPGNFPLAQASRMPVKARLAGEGFQILAGPGLGLDRIEAELGQLQSQGFSRRDPQIMKSMARRKKVPVGLLADRSGSGYFRFTARLQPGASLSLLPGALRVTVRTKRGTVVVDDQGYLLEDRRAPAGCRPPSRSTLALASSRGAAWTESDFLVRLPIRGDIVGLELVRNRFTIARK